jgi:hypothetical protein
VSRKYVIAVDGFGLVRMLTDLLRSAGTDAAMPMLHGVLLHTAKRDDVTVLVGTSTDRFVAAQAHTEAVGRIPKLWVPYSAAHRIVTVMKPMVRKDRPDFEIEVREESFTVRLASLDAETGIAVTGKRGKPKLPERIVEMLQPVGDQGSEELTLARHPLTVITQVAKDRGIPARIQFFAPNKPVLVQIGDQYRCVAMPMRRENRDTVPVFPIPADKPAAQQKPETNAA